MRTNKTGAILAVAFTVLLLGATTPSQAIVEEDACIDEDQTKGMGGQSVRCAFTCPGPAGTVNISVMADDPDASVSGTASCPGGDAHCSGQKDCSDSEPYDGDGAGTCSAESDEFWDSGLYVECSAELEDTGGTCTTDPGCEPPEWCPVTRPQPICIDPLPPIVTPVLPEPEDLISPVEGGLSDILDWGGGGDLIGPTPDPFDFVGPLPDPYQLIGPGTNTVLGVVNKYVENDFELNLELDFLESVVQSEAQSYSTSSHWSLAFASNPGLPEKVAASASYVYMQHVGGVTVGISCAYGVCTNFTPSVEINEAGGIHLSNVLSS